MRPQIITRFVNWFLNRLYQPFAFFYDIVAAIVSFGQWKVWVLKIISHLNGKKILELGFGPGHLQSELQAKGYWVFGLDRSKQMIKITKNRIRKSGRLHTNQPEFTLIRAVAQFIPFQSHVFDVVAATFPTEYIFEPISLFSIHRVLKPDGALLILLGAYPDEQNLITKILKTLYLLTGQAPSHPEEFLKKIQTRLENSGFTSHTEWIEAKYSRLLLIKAHKSSNSIHYPFSID